MSVREPSKELSHLRIACWLNYEMPVVGHHSQKSATARVDELIRVLVQKPRNLPAFQTE
jgi:hypothetical protein